MNTLPTDYKLLDSGNEQKLEQFGDLILIRPASQAIWEQRDNSLWQTANNRYVPNKGWQQNGSNLTVMNCSQDCKIQISLQDNGQVGLFPEHFSYLSEIKSNLTNASNVLSLFAYTGLATCYLANSVKQITHVDISAQCLGWAKENLKLNKIAEEKVRFIKDDAIKFLEREVKRENKYDCIILDPTSFSRVSKNKTWDLVAILKDIVEDLKSILNDNGYIYFTAHLTRAEHVGIANMFYDHFADSVEIEISELNINEHTSKRALSASTLIKIKA